MAFELDPPEPDGLVTPEVGPWATQKHRFLSRYIDAFTTSMRKHWQYLHYVDLFANAGIQRIRGTSTLIWGSPLIAAQSPQPFNRLHLCEMCEEYCKALDARLRRAGVVRHQLICGDANERISEIFTEIPQEGALTLTFVDPHGFHAGYEMLRTLSRLRTDLIIFFPDRLDANRNLQRYSENERSSLSTFLGTHTWVERVEANPWAQRIDVLRHVLREQLGKLNFRYVEFERVYGDGQRPYYQLVFASTHPRGAEIWRNVQRIKPGGQRTLGFD